MVLKCNQEVVDVDYMALSCCDGHAEWCRYGRNWKHIQNAIGSKTVIQVQSSSIVNVSKRSVCGNLVCDPTITRPPPLTHSIFLLVDLALHQTRQSEGCPKLAPNLRFAFHYWPQCIIHPLRTTKVDFFYVE